MASRLRLSWGISGGGSGSLLVALSVLGWCTEEVAGFALLPSTLPAGMLRRSAGSCHSASLNLACRTGLRGARAASAGGGHGRASPRNMVHATASMKEQQQVDGFGGRRTDKMLYPEIPFDFETVALPQHEPPEGVLNIGSLFERLKEEARMFEGSPLLVHQMQKHVLQRGDLYEAMASVLSSKLCSEDHPEHLLFDKLIQVLKTTPKIMSDMVKDLQWIQEIDPATHGLLQPFLYFKGFHAVQIQRIGHSLWVKNDKTDKMLALSLQSRCAEVFGVDAHPGAVLSHSICMDHASGVVIGETATIGHNCYILHGVTLGATGKAGTFDRHPKVGNHVKIGAGSMILGNIPIGDDVVVGAAAIVTIPIKQGETVVGINRVLSKEQRESAADVGKNMETWLYDI